MGRKIPLGENQTIHPILSISLLVACMAAIAAFISSLCVFRKKSPPSTDSQRKTTENQDAISPPPNETATTAETTREPPSAAAVVGLEDTNGAQAQPSAAEETQLPLPPPPGMPHLRGTGAASCHVRTGSLASSGGKLLSSMSMGVQKGGMMMGLRQASKRDEQHDKKRDKKLKHEDSIWKKTIILGEKCRVPDEDDDTIICDDKGNRISTYHHRKAPSSLSVSRQTSFIDPDVIPSSTDQQQK